MSSDVVIIGAGPVGLTAALLLARHGLRVDIVEKRVGPMTTPRAVAVDDESLRIWQACGVGDALREHWGSGEIGQCVCTYRDERGRAFLRIHQRAGEFGHPHAAAIHEARVEATLLAAVARDARIAMHEGCEVQRLSQDDATVTLGVIGREGRCFELRARWAIACDGAGSFVRETLRIAMDGEELPHPWLVANLEDRGAPGHVTITCRRRNTAVTMPLPHALRRVEVQLDADDPCDWLDDDAEVRRRLLLGWSGARDARIEHRAICRFRSAIAERWRDGRVFLAGDAAHQMPPFAGQGLGAGLRDVANLAFKLAAVTQGWLAPCVLDSYERERRPHVEKMTRLATRLGRMMMPRSRVEAALVQNALRIVGASPRIAGGWLLRGPSIQQTIRSGFIVPAGRAGHYLPQPSVVVVEGGHRVPLDELLGPRMTWIALANAAGARAEIRPPLFQLGDTILVEGRDFHDPELVLRRRYGDGGIVLVRPDRVVCFHVRSSDDPSKPISRRLACQADSIFFQQARGLASPEPHSSPSQRPDASPTARIRAS